MEISVPSIDEVGEALRALQPYLRQTPIVSWDGGELADLLGPDTHVVTKLELMQRTGSFKARGAMTGALKLNTEQIRRGVTTVSSGNHAIATAFAAQKLGTSAKVVVLSSANPMRVARCRRLGAEIVVAPTGPEAFELAERFVAREGRTLIHPYEGRHVALGAGTLGLEFLQHSGDLDAVIVAIGGGGLCAGVASVVRQLQPECRVYGVEPIGADVMYRSIQAGHPLTSRPIETIADSLGAPFTCPYTFELCRRNLDDLVLVDDDQIRYAMALIFRELKLVVEPAAAAATAALVGPLRQQLAGKKLGLIICGANIDSQTYLRHLSAAPAEVPGNQPVCSLKLRQ